MAVAGAHPVGKFLEGVAVAPGRRPELALGLAPVLRLVRRLGLLSRQGVAVAVAAGLTVRDGLGAGDNLRLVGLIVVDGGHVASSETQKAGAGPFRDQPPLCCKL